MFYIIITFLSSCIISSAILSSLVDNASTDPVVSVRCFAVSCRLLLFPCRPYCFHTSCSRGTLHPDIPPPRPVLTGHQFVDFFPSKAALPFAIFCHPPTHDQFYWSSFQIYSLSLLSPLCLNALSIPSVFAKFSNVCIFQS